MTRSSTTGSRNAGFGLGYLALAWLAMAGPTATAHAQAPAAADLDQAIECAAHFQRLIPQDAGEDADGALFGLLASRALDEAEGFAARQARAVDIDARVAARLAELSAKVGAGPAQQSLEAGFRECFARYMAG